MRLDINMQFRLILLFVYDKMEVPLTKDTVFQMCSVDNDWVPYMDCASTVDSLISNNFIIENGTVNNQKMYSLTSDGRLCLSYFYTKVLLSLREKIKEYITQNRSRYKKLQEYVADYIKNEDGTYTVIMKIESRPTVMEIKINVDMRDTAENMYDTWRDKASMVYETLYELLIAENK